MEFDAGLSRALAPVIRHRPPRRRHPARPGPDEDAKMADVQPLSSTVSAPS